MDLVATGILVKGVRIEGFTDGTTPAKVYELSLGDVVATKVADGRTAATACPSTTARSHWSPRMKPARKPVSSPTTSPEHHRRHPRPSSLALSPDGSGGPVTPAKYFLAISGVKGDSLDANHKGWFEISGFDFGLGNTSSIGSATGGAGAGKVTFSPTPPWTAIPPSAAAGAGGNGCDAEWCDAGRRERRGPTGLPRPRQRVGHERGAPRRLKHRTRSDADPPLRPDRARDIPPGRHGQPRAEGQHFGSAAGRTGGSAAASPDL